MDTGILIPFLNRSGEFDPAAWHMLVPKGEFPIKRREGKEVREYIQVVDDRAVEQIVAHFNRQRSANPEYRLLVDFEHFSHDESKSSEAARWGEEMEARADGVWFRGEWSDSGEKAVRNKRYRYISPVWFPHQTEKLGGNRFRPIAVNDAGLTNKPNLGDALVPFWNRASDDTQPGREATTQHDTTMKDRLIQLMKMDASATDDQVIARVTAFMNRASEADTLQTKFTTLETEHGALKNRHTSLLNVSVDRVLDENKDVITAESKDAWKNRLTEDFDGTSALLKGIKKPEGKAPVHQPGKGAAATAGAGGQAKDTGSPFLNRVAELRAADGQLSESAAIVKAAEESPALYDEYREALAPKKD